MPLAVHDFLNPQYLLPVLSAVVVAAIGLLSSPGSRQRAKHELELYVAMKEQGLTEEAESVRIVLDRRVYSWRFWALNRAIVAFLASQAVGLAVYASIGSGVATARRAIILGATSFLLTALLSLIVVLVVAMPHRRREAVARQEQSARQCLGDD